eukprot:g22692.t1
MAGIRWKATVAKNRYREATSCLRDAIHHAVEESEYMRTEAFAEVDVPEGEDAVQAPHPSVLMSLARFAFTGMPPKEHDLNTLVENWPFSSDDPTVRLASHWLRSRFLLKKTYVRYLDIALHGGHTQSITKAYAQAAAAAVPPRIYHKFAIMQAVGAMCLGVEPDQLIMASGFAKELADKARLVRQAASAVEAGRIPTLRAASRPPRVVHAVRMLNNQKALIENLVALPDWIQSGRTEPIRRAKEHWQKVQRELGRRHEFSIEVVRRFSILAAQFLNFLQQLFDFYDLTNQSSVAPDKRKGAHEMVRDADALRLVELQAWRGKHALSSHQLFSTAWAIVGGDDEVVEDCVACAQRQLTEALALTTVSNAALGSICRGLKPPSRDYVAMIEPRRSSKFLTMGASHVDRYSDSPSTPKASGNVHVASKKIEASRAFKHSNVLLREVDVMIIRITGEEVGYLHMPISSTVKDCVKLIVMEQVPAERQVLLLDNKEVPAHTAVKNLRKDRESIVYFTLLYRSDALVHRIEVAQCIPADYELTSLLGGKLSDPAVCLIYGTSGFDSTVARPGDGARRQGQRRTAIALQLSQLNQAQALSSLDDGPMSQRAFSPGSPRRQSLQIVMLDLMRTMIEILRAHSWGTPRNGSYAVQVDTPWQMQVVCEILELSSSLLRKPLVPQANLCVSMRLLEELEEAGLPATYQPEFGIRRMTNQGSVPHTPHTPHTASSATDRSFFPVRSLAAANMSFLLQAEKAFKESGKVLKISFGLENMCEVPPNCTTLDDVLEATQTACDQLVALAEKGIAIVNPHVEYVRCAIDSAGLAMLSSPPPADPVQRLHWAEVIMSMQLSPLPIFDQTLRRIARCIDQDELAEIANKPEPPEAVLESDGWMPFGPSGAWN